MSLFNVKLKVDMISERIVFTGNKEWVDFCERLFADINSISNNQSTYKPFLYTSDIFDKYFYASAVNDMMSFLKDNDIHSDSDLFVAIKSKRFVQRMSNRMINFTDKKLEG